VLPLLPVAIVQLASEEKGEVNSLAVTMFWEEVKPAPSVVQKQVAGEEEKEGE
jgi:hypothetical protein